jgi:hypothetical protein
MTPMNAAQAAPNRRSMRLEILSMGLFFTAAGIETPWEEETRGLPTVEKLRATL